MIFHSEEDDFGFSKTWWWEPNPHDNKKGRWHGAYASKEFAEKAAENFYEKQKLKRGNEPMERISLKEFEKKIKKIMGGKKKC